MDLGKERPILPFFPVPAQKFLWEFSYFPMQNLEKISSRISG